MTFSRYDTCEAAYVFASLYHTGRGSRVYAVFARLERLGFRPRPNLSEDTLTEEGQASLARFVTKGLRGVATMTLTAKVRTGRGTEIVPCKVKGDGWAITVPVHEDNGPACGYWLTHESSGMAFRVNARDLASLEMAREYLVTCGLNWRMAANRVEGSRIHCEALRHACEIAGDSTFVDTMTQHITKKWGKK